MEQQTEREIILKYTDRWFRTSEWSMERFGLSLLAPALAAKNLIEPLPAPENGAEYLRSVKAWGMRINRIFNGTAAFPLEWRGVWLECLPPELARQAMRDCLALFGLADVYLPTAAPTPQPGVRSSLGEVTRGFGDFLAASAPAHNGTYDHNDDPAAVEKMIAEGTEAVTMMISELIAVAAGTGRSVPALQLLIERVRHG